jgi:REP element-mobilizing transposase RayT
LHNGAMMRPAWDDALCGIKNPKQLRNVRSGLSRRLAGEKRELNVLDVVGLSVITVVEWTTIGIRGVENCVKKKRQQRQNGPQQRELDFPQHGGARRGAGRKPKGVVAGPSHAARSSTPARHPLLVTQRLCAGLRSLRQRAEFEVVRGAIAEASERDGFRIVHFSVQTNHLHYICEARGAHSLTSGMRSLGVMIARRLNALWKRTGQVFAERYHARALATPNEVRQALAYVLNNARKHGIFGDGPDPYSSGAWFDGWSPSSETSRNGARDGSIVSQHAEPTATAETWLLRVGWRRRGLIDWREIPGGKAAQRARAKEEARIADSIQRSLAAAALNARKRQGESTRRVTA